MSIRPGLVFCLQLFLISPVFSQNEDRLPLLDLASEANLRESHMSDLQRHFLEPIVKNQLLLATAHEARPEHAILKVVGPLGVMAAAGIGSTLATLGALGAGALITLVAPPVGPFIMILGPIFAGPIGGAIGGSLAYIPYKLYLKMIAKKEDQEYWANVSFLWGILEDDPDLDKLFELYLRLRFFKADTNQDLRPTDLFEMMRVGAADNRFVTRLKKLRAGYKAISLAEIYETIANTDWEPIGTDLTQPKSTESDLAQEEFEWHLTSLINYCKANDMSLFSQNPSREQKFFHTNTLMAFKQLYEQNTQ